MLSNLPIPNVLHQPQPSAAPPTSQLALSSGVLIPPYGRRKNFVPRKAADYGDGGAFPEIHVAQYPCDMGRSDASHGGKTLAVAVDSTGNVSHNAIVTQGANRDRIVHTGHGSVVPKLERMSAHALARPDEEAIAEATKETAEALQLVVTKKIAISNPSTLPNQPGGPTYIKYTPSEQGAAFNSGAGQRIIKMQEMPMDPLEPPKFRHTKVPRGPGSPPVPVMHSPPRPITQEDHANWKIPPCISNWKNAKGYTIPLDKRLAADGRGLQTTVINDKFASLSEALFTAESKAREAISLRSAMQKELLIQEKTKKEAELRELAMKARMEKGGGLGASVAPSGAMASRVDAAHFMDEEGHGGGGRRQPAQDQYDSDEDLPGPPPIPDGYGGGGDAEETYEEREARRKRDEIREERKRERERERRLEAKEAHGGKRSKITRDRDRDIGEKVALGMAKVTGGEVMYDQRLFNQDQGMASGFGAEDSYGVYDKALFADRTAAGGLYRPKATEEGEVPEDALRTEKFKPDKGFKGADVSAGPRHQPVEFERQGQQQVAPPAVEEEADPFGLDSFLARVKTSKGGR